MGWLAALGLAAANVCLYGSFLKPYAESLGRFADPGIMVAGGFVFLFVPLVIGSNVVRSVRKRGGMTPAGKILMTAVFLVNASAATGFCVLSPRAALVDRVQWLPRRLSQSGLVPRALLRSADDPALAREVAPVVIGGRLRALALDLDGLDAEFVESHTTAGATESGAVVYALAKGFLGVSDMKGFLDGKALTGGDRTAVEALAEEHKAFEKKWKPVLEGFDPTAPGTVGGRAFLADSLGLFKKTVTVLVARPEPAARAEAKRRADELAAEFMKGAVFTTQGPGRIRVDWKPGEGRVAQPEMPVSFRLLFEEGRWRSEGHLAMVPKEVLGLVKELQRQAGLQSAKP